MSKVGGALPSWYWPVGIPRRVPVVQQPLGRVLRQRLSGAGDKPAIVSGERVLSCSELLAEVLNVAGGLQSLKLVGPFAVLDVDPVESLILMLGGLFAGRLVFLPDRVDDPGLLASHLAEAKVAAVLTSGGLGTFEASGIETVRKGDLAGAFNQAGGPKRAVDPAVLIPSGRGVVTHSHFSLSAMVASFAAFIPKLREASFVCTEAFIGSWESLTGILLAMFHGMPIVFSGLDSPASRAEPGGESYVIVNRHQADAILARRRVPARVAEASYVFVSTGIFKPAWRSRMESLCGRPIFTIWGMPELGPVVAPHPTWLPPHGHGFPLVNVSLVPIDPGTGRVSIVPWEMLQQAEMGVEALSAMLGYADPARNVGIKSGTALRTHQIASMDHVGVVVMQGREHQAGDDGGR